jgi:hypothetical protein
MRRGTKIQIRDRNHPLFLAYGVFIKNKLGKKALIRIHGKEVVLKRDRFQEV